MRAVGLDVGGSECKVLVHDDGVEVDRMRIPTPGTGMQGFVTSLVSDLVADGARSVGVGLAGLVRHPDGTFVWGPHLEGRAVPYRDLVSGAAGFEVTVDNDANMAALAESRAGAGSGADPLVMVVLGTGIGVGIVSGGRVYRGSSFAGEAGHIRVVEDGAACECGGSGCWETVVSGSALAAAAARIVVDEPDGLLAGLVADARATGAHLTAAADAGDPAAGQALVEAGRWLGRGLATLVLLFDPARIVVGGGAAADERLLAAATEELGGRVPGWSARGPVPVVGSAHGAFSGALGAVIAGREVHNVGRD